jgi:hypothetical protein
VRGSRVVEHWAARDDLGMLRQLAVLPETGNLARIKLGRPGSTATPSGMLSTIGGRPSPERRRAAGLL